MKVLITGGQGQIAFALQRLKHETCEFIALNRQQCDISDIHAVRQAISKHQPQWVVNCAAYTKVDLAESEREQALAVNYQGTQHVAQICEQANIPLCHLSTDYVFNGEQNSPYSEEDEPIPCNYYGFSKLLGEQTVQQHCKKFIILRVASVFGSHGHNFVKTILGLAQTRETLQIVSDQICCPTSTLDIAETIATLIAANHTQPAWGIYHYCGTPAISWHGFAKSIIKIAACLTPLKVNRIAAIPATEYLTEAQRPRHSVLSCHKIQQQFPVSNALWLPRLQQLVPKLLEQNPQESV